MADLHFRSDVSMQDVHVPKLVLFYLIPDPLLVLPCPPIPAPFLKQVPYTVNLTAESHVTTTALKITCGQDAPLAEAAFLLLIGSDINQCSLVLDRHHSDPTHCQIFAQLNSGFDVWIIRDNSTLGTRYRTLKAKSPQNADLSEELEEEELVHCGSRAVHGLRYLKIGPYGFHCRPSEDEGEIVERDRWFRRHEPIPVNSGLWEEQLDGRSPCVWRVKNIGKGGFGEVFKGMEMQTGLLVAVKKQKVGSDRGVENVRREIQSMKNLEHRNVAKILLSTEEPPEDGQRVFHLVMPLFPCSLRDALPMMKSGSKRNAMIQMIEGLKYIHACGFLHRDIKPENVFISEQTPTNIVLGDLGLLSPVGAIGRGAGTKIYKAPEINYENRQTPAIDVFALGITFLQMQDERAFKDGWHGLKKWVESLWDHPPPPPFSRLIIQMTAPYPPTLRPGLNTIQDLILQQADLPESVQGPQLSLTETLRMLEQQHALMNQPVPFAVPIIRPAPLQPQTKYVKARLAPKDYGLNEERQAAKKAGPLDIIHQARGSTLRGPSIAAPKRLERSCLRQDPPAITIKPVQRQPARGVDFTRPCEDPNNIFARKKIEFLQAELEAERRLREIDKEEVVRLAKELRDNGREYQRYRKANRACHKPCPGEWPSRSTYPGSGDGSRHRRNDRPGRSVRARINTHARHNERTSKREQASFQTKILDGLALAIQSGASGIGNTLSKSIRWILGFRSLNEE